MVAKQRNGRYSPDGSKYVTLTDGVGNLLPLPTLASTGSKRVSAQAPDGSIYLTLTNGSGTLV